MVNTEAFAALDTAAASWCGGDLAGWVRAGSDLEGRPVRCPVTCVAAHDARDLHDLRRLDLALRQLHAQPESHWCREAGEEAMAVVLSWPLPARAVAVFTDGVPEVLVLAVGCPSGAADLWRFHLDAGDPLTARAGDLLALV